MATAVCDVSKTANTAIQQVMQIGGLLNDQIIPALKQVISGNANGGNGQNQGQNQNQNPTPEQIAEMMASGQVPNPGNGTNGTGIGMDVGVGGNGYGYNQQGMAMGGYGQPNPGRAFAGLMDRILQAIPLLTQLQGMRQQPDPKAVFINNFSESIEMLKAVMGMADQLKKSVTTDLGMVEKAASVGQKVKKAVSKEE